MEPISNGMKQYILISQIVISVILVVLIILQQRGTALGSSFGSEGGFYATRRGLQKKLLWATVIFGTLFIILAAINLAV